MSGLHFDFTGNPSGLVDAANKSRIAIQGITDEADKAGMKIDEFLGASKNFVTSMTGIGIGVAGLQSFAKELVNVRSEFQDTEAKLKVFLKSEQAAADMMSELEDLAWNNVFEFTDITKAAAQLLAFKTDAKDVGDTINRLSEIAAGTGASLGDLVDRFNKVKATGNMDSNMVQSFSAMGVDVKSVLAELEGKSRSDYEGVTLTFQDLQKVIHNLTDEGGMFFGMMKERGKNLSDSIAGVRDNFALMMNDIGKSVQGPVKDGIDKANELIENWREVAKAIGGVVVAFGSYKAAFATIEGIRSAHKQINYQLEAQELKSVTQATQEAYKVEIEMLEQQLNAGTASRDADLEIAVAKGELTQAQAAEIASLRELAAEQVNQLTLKAQMAQADAAAAARELASLDNAANAKKFYEDEVAAIQDKLDALTDEASEQQRSALVKKKTIATENLEIATRQANEAATKRQTVAQRAETASKNAEALSAQADAARQGMDAVGKTVNTTQTKLLTRAQMALKMALDATGLSMLANPYVLAAIAVASLCLGIYKLITAESAAEKATRKHNDALAKQKSLRETLSSSMDNSDSVISDTSTDKRTKQVEFDAMLNGSKSYKDSNGEDLPEQEAAVLREVEKRYAEHYGTLEAMEAASDEERRAVRSKIEADYAMEQKEQELQNAINRKAALEEWNRMLASNGAMGGYKGPREFREADEAIRLAREERDKIRESYEKAEAAERAAADAEANREKVDVDGTVQRIMDAETALELARQAFALDASESNKQALKEAEENVKMYINNYQLQTGKQWKDTKKLNEERQKAIRAAANEETRIRNSAIEDQRKARKSELAQTIKELKQEEEEYRKANNGRGSGTLNQKIKNAKLQFELDMKDLDRQWNEWKHNHERETIHLQMDIEMDTLQRAVDNARTAAERETAKSNLRAAEDRRMESDNREKADDEIKSKLGGSLDSLEKYTQSKDKSDAELADILGIDAETVSQLREIENHYSNILSLQMAQKAGQRGQEDFQQKISDLESYMGRAQQLTSEYEQTLENIRKKDNISETVNMHTAQLPAAAARERDLAKNIRDTQMVRNAEDTGIDAAGSDTERLLEQINGITINMASKTTEEIVTLYQQVLDELNSKIGEMDMTIDTDREALESGQEFNEKTGQMEDITPERRIEIEQEINNLIAERQVMTQMQADVQAKATEAANQSLTAQQKRMQQFDEASDHLINGFASLNQSAKTISATFGGAMSKNGKKAMQAIEGISDAAGNALSGLKTMIPALLTMFKDVGTTGTAIQTEEAAVSTGTSTAIEGTSTAAATAIRTVETASVILAVISAALQIIQSIINVVMQFSEAAQMQETIDEDIERVDALKRQQEALNDAYKDEAGTAYYKGMSKAAKNYYNLIKAQEKTVADSRALYERQANKYGEDSDKAKDAKKQYDEQLDALREFEQEQKEMFDEMAQDLLTTDLNSFTENLADQYIEGFEKGMDGIDGVLDDVLNDMQKQMMKKGLQIALENLFKSTWDNMKKMTEDGELTTSEMDAIMSEMDAKAAQSKQIAEQYYQAMSERGLLGDADVETSSGGFSSMTQDQADVLSARFTAVQASAADVDMSVRAMQATLEQLGISDGIRTSILNQMMSQFTLANEIALNQLDELRKITDNTSTLADTNRRLRAIEENTNSLRE